MNRIDEIFTASDRTADFAAGYLEYLREILAALDHEQIAAFTEALLDARSRDASIFFLGNGGSAATASHFANDIAIGSRSWEQPFRAVALTDNVAVMTAIANDYGYEHVFTNQLKTQMRDGDVVVGISVSGNSPNVVGAMEWAGDNGATTIGLTGFDGGRVAAIAEIVVHAPTNPGEYGPAEDVHMVIDHLVGAYLIKVCAAETVASAEGQ